MDALSWFVGFCITGITGLVMITFFLNLVALVINLMIAE
tara:strand:+ start:562 stop:678 length:117 start_codon:yes stop_codon:yes gene_type:complete